MAPNEYHEISEPHISGDVCDESRCVSSGLSSLHNNSFTCYGDDDDDNNNNNNNSSRNNNSDGLYPMMCADGYLPRVVEDEPPIVRLDAALGIDATLRYFTCCPPTLPKEAVVARHCSEPSTATVHDLGGETDYDQYYRNGDDVDVAVDVDFDIDIDVDVDGDTNLTATTRICGNNKNRSHLRRMKSKRYFHGENEIDEIESHVCCDSLPAEPEPPGEKTTTTTTKNNYLDETECVPYHSGFYDESRVQNRYGRLASVACHFPEGTAHEAFRIPRFSDSLPPRSYDCCRAGRSPPPFVEDAAFGLTIYPQIVLSSVAVACSLLTILGLSLPLVRQLRRRARDPRRSEVLQGSSLFSFRRSTRVTATATAAATAAAATTSFRGSSRALEIPEGSQRSDAADSVDAFLESLRRKKTPSQSSKFSTYNLYLVYLAIPDLLMNLCILGMYGGYASNKEFRSGLCGFIVSEAGADGCFVSGEDGILFTSVLSGYWAANIYLNAFVAYEVYALLRNSKNFQRHTPPSIRKVTLQASAICAFSVVVAVSYYFLNYGQKRAGKDGAGALSSGLFLVQTVVLNAVLLGFVPILFFPSICLLIWRRKLMPRITSGATTREKALRELAWYFFRIVSVFAGCWIPIAVVSALGGTSRFSITFLILAMQQIVSTCVSLTKSDVRKHLIDLVAPSSSSSSSCGGCCCSVADTDNDSDRISRSMHYSSSNSNNSSRPRSSDLVSSTSKMASMAEE